MSDQTHIPKVPTDADLDEIETNIGSCRVKGDPGPDMILVSDLAAEIRRYRAIVRDLAANTTTDTAHYCVLCSREAADFDPAEEAKQHAESCPWRRARELMAGE